MALPEGYKRLLYIESSGTQYIDVGFIPNQNTGIEMSVMPLSVESAAAGVGFIPYGAGESYNSKAFECYTTNNAYEFNYSGQNAFIGTPEANKIIKISHLKNEVVISDDTGEIANYSFESSDFEAPYTLTLFAIHRSTVICGVQRIDSCEVYDNGVLIRKYVPVKKTDGTPGFFDEVNEQFSGNSGTGEFIAGPEVYGNDENVVLLLHGEEIVDDSQNGLAITNNGVAVSETQSKFGRKSLYLNGASYLEIASSLFLITNGDFTIDWWQYKENAGTFCCLNPWETGYSHFLLEHTPGNTLYSAYNTGDAWAAISQAQAFVQETGAWIHWAFVKNGTTLTTYRNGTKYWTGTVSNSYVDNAGGFLLGCHADAGNRDYFSGYVDELRVSNIARWSADFAVQENAYEKENIIPEAPAGFTYEVADGVLTLTWSVDENATGFNVYRNGEYVATTFETVFAESIDAAVQYTYQVTGYNDFGEGEPSEIIIEPSAAPGTPENLRAAVQSFNLITLVWLIPTGAIGFNIYRDGDLIGSQTNNEFTDTGLTTETAYRYSVTAYNSVGESAAAVLEISTTAFKLITDRTQADVNRVTALSQKGINGMSADELAEFIAGPKGAYNASDLNRVESAVEYVVERLAVAGIYPILQTKTTWQRQEYMVPAKVERYLNNVRHLRSLLTMASDAPAVPADMERLTYEEANNIERLLEIIDETITQISKTWFYSGEIYSGEV